MRNRLTIEALIVMLILLAMMLPAVILGAFVVRNEIQSSRAEIIQRNSIASKTLSIALAQTFASYRSIASAGCNTSRWPDNLLVCGRVTLNGELELKYERDKRAEHLSKAALIASDWYPDLLKASDQNFFRANVSTGAFSPYFRRYIVLGDRDSFILLDQIEVYSIWKQFESLMPGLQLKVQDDHGNGLTLGEGRRFYQSLFAGKEPFQVSGSRTRMKNENADLFIAFGNIDRFSFFDRVIVLIIFSLGLILVLALVGAAAARDVISGPIGRLSSAVMDATTSLKAGLAMSHVSDKPSIVQEVADLQRGVALFVEEISERDERLAKLTEELVRERTLSELGDMATQIAHDIRSPLAAIDLCTNAKSTESEEGEIVKSAVHRIKEIVNSLVSSPDRYIENHRKPICPYSLAKVILAEKKKQYQNLSQVDFYLEQQPGSEGLLKISGVEFMRALSNTVDNAIQAKGDAPLQVTVRLKKCETTYTIEVLDNGRGIEASRISRLGTRGFTDGKVGGAGLGLYQTRLFVERMNGSLKIESQLGVGTKVQMQFNCVSQ